MNIFANWAHGLLAADIAESLFQDEMDGVALLDAQGIVVRANPRMRSLVGNSMPGHTAWASLPTQPACALAAVAYGADGLCIESHVSPSNGIGDDPKQALTPEVLADTIQQAKALWALRREAKAAR